jgi:2,5-diamino-6-(ribosylamino)-4(3H)-pyrimidinone 5'-phosphate reductase
MSADGKIALKSRRQTAISSDEDLRRVHMLRNSCDAILVGVETVLSDDPNLTVKEKYVRKPRNPVRIVLDSRGRTPIGAQVLNGAAKTVIVTNERCKKIFPKAEVIRCGTKGIDLPRLLDALEKMGIGCLLVEGGSKVIWSFLEKRLADEVTIFIGSMVIGGDESPTPAGGIGAVDEQGIIPLTLKSSKVLGSGILLTYEVVK